MLTPQLRHKHTGLGGDGEKIRYQDLEGIPETTESGNTPFLGDFILTGTGNKVITGVGFKPKVVRFWFGDQSGVIANTGSGIMTELSQYAINNANATRVSINCIYFGNPLVARAVFVSMDADGFTIDCTFRTADAYVFFECE